MIFSRKIPWNQIHRDSSYPLMIQLFSHYSPIVIPLLSPIESSNSSNHLSMDWFKGKSTGNHFPIKYGAFRFQFSLKPIHWTLFTRLGKTTAHGSSPLHLASAGGHPAAVRLLLELGCDLNGGDSSGATPWRWTKNLVGKHGDDPKVT